MRAAGIGQPVGVPRAFFALLYMRTLFNARIIERQMHESIFSLRSRGALIILISKKAFLSSINIDF